jgi:tetratricopeptide (TPR) repeat protein
MKKPNKNKILETKISEIGALLNASKFTEALGLLDQSRASLEHLQIFHNMLGVTYSGLRDHESAVRHFLNSVKVNPLDPMPFTGIANSLAKNLQFEEAEKYYNLALVVDENYRDAIVGLGVVNFQKSNYTACEDYFRKALESKPSDPTILTNLANTYSAQGKYNEALPLWDKALTLKPSCAQARMNRGLAGLGMGKFETAWDDYEDRFHEDNFIPERFKEIPKWPGPGHETVPVLIWVEQGIGDEIMFASIYSELSTLKEKFAAECNPRLIDTFKESFPHIFFFPTFALTDHSAFRYQISIASLGRILRTSKQAFDLNRSAGGFLKQSADALSPLARTSLENLPKPWIGVSWESYALTMNFRGRKSIPSGEFAEFTKGFKGSFINLQFPNPHKHENPAPQIVPENVHTLPDLDLKNDLRGLTSLLREMDHVVTIGNSVAHLCGAFGIPTTVLLPSVADWRWGFSGDKSVWYDSLTLRRNKDPNSWAELLSETKTGLFSEYNK